MSFIALIKYGIRFVFLQVITTFTLIWYFDNFLIVDSQQKYQIYLSLVDDWERFYPFIPLKYLTIDAVLAFLIFVFLISLYSTNFYTYVNELTYTFRKNYLDEYINIYLFWCTFLFSFFILFRIEGIYRSNLIYLTFLIPLILIIFRNSEIISIFLGRSLFNENYISFNVQENSTLKNLRILSFRNQVKSYSIDTEDDLKKIPKLIESINKELELHLVVINLENYRKISEELEEYLIKLNKKVLIIANNEVEFVSNFIYREEKFENYNLVYFNNDIQYGSKFIIKRILDIILAFTGLIVLIPIFIVVSIFISITDGWSPFVYQNRVGLHGKIFKMIKFRTMHQNAHELRDELNSENKNSGPLFKLENDPRIIKGGSFLRKYSIDELPQLLNVIKGDMSLVGPRPLFDTDRQYFDSGYMRRLNVLPGMTGLLQINDRNTDDFDIWFKYDMEYIENWSIYTDLKIIIKTIPFIFRKKIQGK